MEDREKELEELIRLMAENTGIPAAITRTLWRKSSRRRKQRRNGDSDENISPELLLRVCALQSVLQAVICTSRRKLQKHQIRRPACRTVQPGRPQTAEWKKV